MGTKDSGSVFNLIAPIYALFYNMQRRRFAKILERAAPELDIQSYRTILDVGCGTGALCSVLHEKGLSVTGVDPAEKMLQAATKKLGNTSIQFVQADVLRTLPYKDKEFDISIASYVAHGLQPEQRQLMYAEMSRITKDKVIIHDYNKNRSLLTTFIEWLEGGDYFNFIKIAEKEMTECTIEENPCFAEVTVINVDTRASWYICTPAKEPTTCPLCGTAGVPVSSMTVGHLIIEYASIHAEAADFKLCMNPDCDAVYYNRIPEILYVKNQIRVPIWFKKDADPKYACYCSRVTESQVIGAVRNQGAQTVADVNRITGAMKNADCIHNNPLGTCCHEIIQDCIDKANQNSDV